MLSTPGAKLFATADERSVANDSHLGGGVVVALWWRIASRGGSRLAPTPLPMYTLLTLRWRCATAARALRMQMITIRIAIRGGRGAVWLGRDAG